MSPEKRLATLRNVRLILHNLASYPESDYRGPCFCGHRPTTHSGPWKHIQRCSEAVAMIARIDAELGDSKP